MSNPTDPTSPRALIRHRLELRRNQQQGEARLDARLANARMLTFLGGLALGWLAYGRGTIAPGWLGLPFVGFVASLVSHGRVKDRLERLRLSLQFYEQAQTRLDDRWVGTGRTGSAYLPKEHPYADDLDLFGTGSLFERVSIAQTTAGEATLAGWLLEPAPAEEISQRQASVRELCSGLDLREDLAIAAGSVASVVDLQYLTSWGDTPASLGGWRAPAFAALLSTATALAAVASVTKLTGNAPVYACVLAQILLAMFVAKPVRATLTGLARASRDLDLLSKLLHRIESEAFSSAKLDAARAQLTRGKAPASASIHRLRRLVAILDSRRNVVFAPVALWLHWDVHLAKRIDRWRATHGSQIGRWISAIGEIEALSSLADFTFQCPDHSFPIIATRATEPAMGDGDTSGARLVAIDVGHPLLPGSRCIRNDVRLDGELSVLVVSGSNMSGKSTLLRTIGVNAVLALAGGTVRAKQLSLTPLSIGASIRSHDSLLDGKSRFYAEIVHLKSILDRTQRGPSLVLLDEILSGTNSNDRRAGAGGIVRSLLRHDAIGLITTHDLALTEIARELAPRVENVHFNDDLVDGQLHFDYRMHRGVLQHGNALALMRAVGLDV